MTPERLNALLRRVRSGSLSIEAALRQLRTLPYENLGFASLDHHRTIRQGFPEVIFCEGKTDAQVLTIAKTLLKKKGPLLATRIEPRAARALCRLNRRARYHDQARMVCRASFNAHTPGTGVDRDGRDRRHSCGRGSQSDG